MNPRGLFVAGLVLIGAQVSGMTQTEIASKLNSPTAFAIAPDGRIFIALQGGEVRVLKEGKLLEAPALTLQTVPVDEQGLVSIALDPQFERNNFVYLIYTTPTKPARQRLSRFTLNGDKVQANSEKVLIELGDNRIEYHLGGAIVFGRDGKLYLTTGEGITGDVQKLDNLAGKLLRLNPDGSIPSDNPFYNQTTGLNRAIFAKGLRSPFTMAAQASTGRIYLNDVGGERFEEVNEAKARANYGFPNSEGATTTQGETSPIHAYGRDQGCAIVGGTFYEPRQVQFPQLVGKYLFAEYCKNQVRILEPSNSKVENWLELKGQGAVALAVGPDGFIYVLTRGGSDIGGGSGMHTS